MLHILWLIFKFILILLGVLLGLALLVVLLLLFCPVRYRAQGSKRNDSWKTVEGQANVSWLFHGISVQVYRKEEKNGFSVRILGISLEKLMKLIRKRKKEDTETLATELENISEEAKEEFDDIESELQDEILSEWNQDEVRPCSEDTEIPEKKGLFVRISEKIKDICTKMKNIRLTFHSIHDKIEWWKKFFKHPRTQAAIELVWKYAKGLFRHVLPTRIWGNVVFGFSDPSITGRVLGLLGMSFPFHKNCVSIVPRFDGENILEGEVFLKGRIYGIVLVKAAIAIYFNKNVKYVIRRAKHGKHKEG